jgi:hypothetical protein
VFAEGYGLLSRTLLRWFDLGPLTWPQVLLLPAWAILASLALGAAALFRWLEKRDDYV